MLQGLVPVVALPYYRQYGPLWDLGKGNELYLHLKPPLEGGRDYGNSQVVLHQPEDGLGVHRFMGDLRAEAGILTQTHHRIEIQGAVVLGKQNEVLFLQLLQAFKICGA